jgi:hypothetical protein
VIIFSAGFSGLFLLWMAEEDFWLPRSIQLDAVMPDMLSDWAVVHFVACFSTVSVFENRYSQSDIFQQL